jgi:hypothetical protein
MPAFLIIRQPAHSVDLPVCRTSLPVPGTRYGRYAGGPSIYVDLERWLVR